MDETLLPVDELATEDELRRRYTSLTVAPRSAPEWAYRLVLPRDWVEDDTIPAAKPEPEQMAQIGLFAPPDQESQTLGVQVWATVLPFEVNLTDWLEYYAEQAGMELVEGHVRDPDAGSPLDALAHHESDDQEMLTRLTVFADGERVFLVAGMAEADIYEEVSKTLGVVAVSFEPSEKTGGEFMEELAEYQDATKRISFQYPASWKTQALPTDPNITGVAVRLEGEDELLGYLRVQTLKPAGGGPEEALRSILQDLEAANLKVESLQPALSEGAWGESLWLGEVNVEGQTNLCAIGIKPFVKESDAGGTPSRQTRGVACVLLCAPRERAPFLWMRGKRALEIVLATIRPASVEG